MVPKWEDKVNKLGGNFCLEMKDVRSDQMDDIWKRLLLILVGESWEFSEYVTGIRIVDRQKKYNTLKIEIWTTFGFKNPDFEENERKELKERFRVSMYDHISDFYDTDVNMIFFTEHARKLN